MTNKERFIQMVNDLSDEEVARLICDNYNECHFCSEVLGTDGCHASPCVEAVARGLQMEEVL